MPLNLHLNIEHGEIGLWKVSEEIEELYPMARLSGPDLATYAGISAFHRKKEWLATRALLNNLLNEPSQIKYHLDGRPYLETSLTNISISHSNGYVAIMLHSQEIPGIDIELMTRKVGKVASRFLSPDELLACNEKGDLQNHYLLLHWCAKEAIFKMVPLSNIEFATDIAILVDETGINAGLMKGYFNHKSGPIAITLQYTLTGEVIIVWGSVDQSHFRF